MTPKEVTSLVGQNTIIKSTRDALGGVEFVVSSAPKPYPACKEYSLHFSQKDGLLAITCIGNKKPDSGTWEQLRTDFQEVQKDLEVAYLTPDFVSLDGPKPEKRLGAGSVMLIAKWDDLDGGTVTLYGLATEGVGGQIEIAYLFKGWFDYISRVEAKDSTL